jgi:GT2 family glycosyltransferase
LKTLVTPSGDHRAVVQPLPASPHVSVIIPTCNRPDDVRRCLQSLTRVMYPSWDILVVDQGDDARAQAVVESYALALPQLRYRRVRVKGTSRARNAGVAATVGAIIAFLDDDCTAPEDWLTQAAAVFARYPRAALVFGVLRPAGGLAEWSALGWTPARVIKQEFEVSVVDNLRHRLRLPRLIGNGACLFVRRDLATISGDFDVHLGPGTHFPSSEDGDPPYRALMAGYSVVGSPSIVVEHYGLRDYASGAAARLLRSYNYGAGAWMMKLLRSGDPFAAIWILDVLSRHIRQIRLKGFVPGNGPTNIPVLLAFLRGLIGSFRFSVDRRTRLYRVRSARR